MDYFAAKVYNIKYDGDMLDENDASEVLRANLQELVTRLQGLPYEANVADGVRFFNEDTLHITDWWINKFWKIARSVGLLLTYATYRELFRDSLLYSTYVENQARPARRNVRRG